MVIVKVNCMKLIVQRYIWICFTLLLNAVILCCGQTTTNYHQLMHCTRNHPLYVSTILYDHMYITLKVMNSHRRDAANSKSSHSHAGRKYSKSSYNFRRFVDVWFCKLWLYKCSRTNCSYNYQSMLAIFGVINPSLLYKQMT